MVYLFIFIAMGYLFFVKGLPWVEADYQLTVAKNFVQGKSFLLAEKFSDIAVQHGNEWGDFHGLVNVLSFIPFAFIDHGLPKNFISNHDQLISFLVALSGVFINAATCVVYFRFLVVIFGVAVPRSVYSALALAFLTILFPYASTNYEGNWETLFLLCATYYLFSYHRDLKLSKAVKLGIMLGVLLNTRETALIFVPICAICFLFNAFHEKRTNHSIGWVLGCAPGVVLWLYYNWARTGNAFLSPLMDGIIFHKPLVQARMPTSHIFRGFFGILLSPGGSMFIYSPIFLVALMGWKNLMMRFKFETFFILSYVLFSIVCNASVKEWFGLFGWGPRYTLHLTPLVMLALPFALHYFMSQVLRKLILIMISISAVVIQLAGVLTNWHARLGLLLARCGEKDLFYTVACSQWWDSVKILFINVWNLWFGRLLFFKSPEYDSHLSWVSLQTSQTVSAWWNRLMVMGVDPRGVGFLMLVGAFIFVICWVRISYLIRSE